MKDRIIERLLTEGHITIEMADAILNNKHGKTEIISDLATDGNITKLEAVTLLKEKESGSYIPNYPIQTLSWNQPITHPYVDWSTPGTSPGQPTWTVTCAAGGPFSTSTSNDK